MAIFRLHIAAHSSYYVVLYFTQVVISICFMQKKLEDDLFKENSRVFNTIENIVLKDLEKMWKFQIKETVTN